MEHHISILFYVRKSKKTTDGLLPVYIRITINGQRIDQSIQRYVQASQWSVQAGRMKGNGNEARQLNLYLDTLTGKVLKFERELVQDGKIITIDSFREKWLGLAVKPRMRSSLQARDCP
jgi:hypothetical protein